MKRFARGTSLSRKLATVAYPSGTSANTCPLGVFQLLQARRDQIRARTSYIGVVREYWNARLDLEQLARGSLPPDAAMMSSVDVSGPSSGEDH